MMFEHTYAKNMDCKRVGAICSGARLNILLLKSHAWNNCGAGLCPPPADGVSA